MWPFKRKSLEDVLYKTKTVKVHGIRFKIKKIDPSHYLEGSKVMLQEYDTYQLVKKPDVTLDMAKQLERIKEHYRDVFLSSVLHPKLKRKPESDEDGIPVDHLFTEMDLAHTLYNEILVLNYGKKKLKNALSQGKRSSK